jgi:hypothetical protein
MNVPNVMCTKAGVKSPIKVVVPNDPDNSPLLIILQKGQAICNYRQMPDGGPYLTDSGYQVVVSGEAVSGQQILNDLRQWILNGCP